MSKICLIGGVVALSVGLAHAQRWPLEGDALKDFIATAKKNIVADFKDPAGAQFRNLFISASGSMPVLCGEVNGKNSYGAYVGFRSFFATSEPMLKQITSDRVADRHVYDSMAPKMCGNRVADVE